MKVGELITALKDTSGWDDDVIIDDGYWAYEVLGVHWDGVIKCCVIKVEDPEDENRV